MTKFSDLNLSPKVLKAVEEAGYETPTPIQAGAIPPALEGRDVLGIAQTGTGKTASFTLPMITMLARGRARARMPRSLVLCPTRELAAQVAENFDTYAKHVKLTKALLIGGVSFKEQDQLIDRGVGAVLATLGAAGAVLVDRNGAWLATPPPITPRSTVGAGDSSLAGYVRAEVGGAVPPQRLQMAVAYGSAAAALPGTTLPTPAQVDLNAVQVAPISPIPATR